MFAISYILLYYHCTMTRVVNGIILGSIIMFVYIYMCIVE